MFKTFYEALNTTKEHHAKFPNLETISTTVTSSVASNVNTNINFLDDEIEKKIQFSGEEVFGKYLDLNELYLEYCNIPNMSSNNDRDYLQYLDKFNNFFYIPEASKGSKQYRLYLDHLWNYLSSFFSKIQPLVNMNELLVEWKDSFNEKWHIGKIAGWKLKESSKKNNTPQPLRLGKSIKVVANQRYIYVSPLI